VASERQKHANRSNAQKSSGPRSSAGRKRASRNSYRHGLAAFFPLTAEHARRVEKLARKIAGNATDPMVLEHARAAAHAEFDLAEVRRVKVATIEKALAFGKFPSTVALQSIGEVARALGPLAGLNMPPAEATLALRPADRTAEAVRRALPELVRLDRYECRAAARRAQYLRAIAEMDKQGL